MRTLLLSTLIALAGASPGWSSTLLAQYIFTGADPIPVSSADPDITASPLSRNGVTPISTDTLFYNGTDWPVGGFNATSYFEVTLSPNAGFLIDYSLVTFDYVVGSNPTYTTELRSSVDNFSSALSHNVDLPGISTYSDSLAALGVQGGPVTFRLYGFVDSNFGSSGLYNHSASFFAASDPIIISGIPEPSGFWLVLGGAMAMAWRRFAVRVS